MIVVQFGEINVLRLMNTVGNMRLICVLSLLAFMVQGCVSAEWRIVSKEKCESTRVIPDKIVLDSTLALRTWERVGDYVVMLLPGNVGEVVHIYTFPEFGFCGSYLRYGRDSDEYLSMNLMGGNFNNSFSLYDMNNKIIRQYSVSDLQLDEVSIFPMHDLGTDKGNLLPSYVDILRIDDVRFLFHVSDRTSEELILADINGRRPISRLCDMLTYRDWTKDQYLEYFYQLDASATHVVRAFENLEKIDIYKIFPTEIKPSVSIEGSSKQMSGDIYNLAVDCGDASFAVCRAGNEKCCVLEVYDYDGKMLSNIQTDNQIYNIIYDEEYKRIYAYAEDLDEPTILVYQLKQ